MRRDDLPVGDDRDGADVALDRHRPECERSRYAVAIVVEGDGLVLVDGDGGTDHARVEPVPGQGQGRGEILGQAVRDRERAEERLDDPHPLGLAPFAKRCVQFIEVRDPRHGRGESALDGLDGPLGIGLLLAASRHAESRIEDVVVGQRRVTRMELSFAALKDQGGDGLGVVPPDFPRNPLEELEGRDHALEDRLGAFEGQGQDEGGVGVGPGGDEEGDQAAAVREVDLDVAEIGFEALAGEMPQRDESFLMSSPVSPDVASHLAIAAVIVVLVAEAAEHLHGGVSLLGRGLLIVGEDLVDDRPERPQDRSGSLLGPGIGLRLGLGQDLTNLPPTVMKPAPISRMDRPSRRARRIAP